METHKHPDGFVCKQCGKCCVSYYDVCETTFSQEEVDRFKEFDKENILAYLYNIGVEGYPIYDGWFSPVTGETVKRCPWLRKVPNQNRYRCRINEVKPVMCLIYPQHDQKDNAIRIGCKGWDHEN